jgi:Spy/CpxP family protein refolding chaperone
MKKWMVIGSAMVLGLVSLGLIARSVERRPWEGAWEGRARPRMGPRLLAMLDNDRVKTYLNLTDPQVDRLRQIVVESEKASVKSRADLSVRGIELRELLRADKPDREAIMKKVDELSSLRADLMKQRVDALLAAKSVLTPEQQKKVRSFLERREGFGMRGEQFRGRRGGWGPPPDAPPRPPRSPAPPGAPGEPPPN